MGFSLDQDQKSVHRFQIRAPARLLELLEGQDKFFEAEARPLATGSSRLSLGREKPNSQPPERGEVRPASVEKNFSKSGLNFLRGEAGPEAEAFLQGVFSISLVNFFADSIECPKLAEKGLAPDRIYHYNHHNVL